MMMMMNALGPYGSREGLWEREVPFSVAIICMRLLIP